MVVYISKIFFLDNGYADEYEFELVTSNAETFFGILFHYYKENIRASIIVQMSFFMLSFILRILKKKANGFSGFV